METLIHGHVLQSHHPSYPPRSWFTPERNPVRPWCPAHVITTALGHREFSGLHFTGSTKVFRDLWKEIGDNVGQGAYKSYPHVVGETGGKNLHLVHQSADVKNTVLQSVRPAFEYQGQFVSSLPSLMLGAQNVDRPEVLSTFKSIRCFASVTQFKQMLLEETAKVAVGLSETWETSWVH